MPPDNTISAQTPLQNFFQWYCMIETYSFCYHQASQSFFSETQFRLGVQMNVKNKGLCRAEGGLRSIPKGNNQIKVLIS